MKKPTDLIAGDRDRKMGSSREMPKMTSCIMIGHFRVRILLVLSVFSSCLCRLHCRSSRAALQLVSTNATSALVICCLNLFPKMALG